jgi:hypothetical protein
MTYESSFRREFRIVRSRMSGLHWLSIVGLLPSLLLGIALGGWGKG